MESQVTDGEYEPESEVSEDHTIKSKKSKRKKHQHRHSTASLKVISSYVEYEQEGPRPSQTSELMDQFDKKLHRLRDLNVLLAKTKGPADGGGEKSKKKKKKRKSKSMEKEKEAGAEETLDAVELLQEKWKLVEELKDEIENETKNIEERTRNESVQMHWRRKQLRRTEMYVESRQGAFMDYLIKCSKEDEWHHYMTCDGLPDPSVLPQLNAFLYLWSLQDSDASMRTLPRQCEIVIFLIKRMDEIIAFSLQASPSYVKNCKHMRQMLRDKLEHWIDLASYCLLRHIERETVRIDLRNSKYVQQLAPLVCCFWALIKLPISMKQVGEKDKKAFEVEFNEVGLAVKMPIDLDCYCTAIRVLWLGFDHYSDVSASYDMPELPNEMQYHTGLLEFCQREFETALAVREEQRESREQRIEVKRALLERILKPASAAAAAGPDKKKKPKKGQQKGSPEPQVEAKPLPFLPTPEEMVQQREDEIRRETRRRLFCRCKKTEINLRKYAMLGGLYRIDLINQPPQPKDMRHDIYLTTLELPKQLEPVKFWRPYKAPPPAPDAERTPEVIEAEMKALEAAMELLVLVTLKLPDTVMWFEPPLVAHWLANERIWSTEDVHDIKYNEEKQTITFRTGRLGLHGLAGYRFVNLPFQSWELKPEKTGPGVILAITGSVIQLEFLVREDLVCLNSIVGGGSTAFEDIKGQFMKLNYLKLKMRAAGCDVFPEMDAASYLKGITPKHPVVLKHLQVCMGLLSTAYAFTWSRWNSTRPAREIVMQLKEIHGNVAKQRVTALVFVTMISASVVNCFEVSQEFTTEPADENDKFYSDIYHYALHHAGIKSRLAIKNASFKLSCTVTSLLEATNVINMSA